MSVLSTGIGSSGIDVGDIGHSLRLRSAASAYLSRSFGAPTNAYGWCYSGFVKLGLLSGRHILLNSFVDSNNRGYLEIDASGVIRYDDFSSSSQRCLKVSTQVLRDPTSWYHIFVLCNTDHATAEDRLQIWVNGVRITSWTTNTNYGLSIAPMINSSGRTHYIGRLDTTYSEDYRARNCFVDNGTALTPSSFGYQNTEINEWVSKSQSAVKAVVDAGGANSFMLDFDNATSLTTLGYDKSSKGNNWTLNNVSLTAGATYDHMLDVPGNSYCTINPLMYRASTGQAIYSYANLRATNDSGVAGKYIWGTQYVTSGKWYWETTVEAIGSAINVIGVDSGLAQNTVFNDSVIYVSNGHKYVNNVDTTYGATYTTGDVIGTLLDKTANTVEFFKNGVSQGVINLVSTSVALGMHSELGSSNGVHVLNFGQSAFSFPANQGTAKTLCQANLPDPAIPNPEKHFDVRTRTGTAGTYSITDLLFPPDLVWIKSRGRAVDHALYDSVRGVQKQLESNQTGAETTETTGITAFNSNGYTGGALDQINGTTATNSFVDWLWKMGGAAVTNNNGSISSQVSANVLAGQSVVKHINTGAPATIGHGLLQAPQLIINKVYDRTENWRVYFGQANKLLILNSTAAEATDTNIWNNTQPTSSVFSIGTYFSNGDDIISYCFHSVPGYSKVGSYTGNGSADGPYVECGFKPKYVLYKKATGAASNWVIFDAIRNTYNVIGEYLLPNSSAAEGSLVTLDFTATGFKLRTTNVDNNGNGETFIFYAIADVPAKYSLAR